MPKQCPLVHNWDCLPEDAPIALLTRRRIIGEQMMISRVMLSKGCDVPSHSHANEQFAVLLSGRVRFGLGAPGTPEHREVVVSGGEVLHLPGNLPHSAFATEDSVILDLFSPPSQTTGIDRR
ncbi:MAG: cupin domain-containing protein [Phycisphaerales bacterium]|nr:cupin domain-containing protein [Phycisphaerales bacterium]